MTTFFWQFNLTFVYGTFFCTAATAPMWFHNNRFVINVSNAEMRTTTICAYNFPQQNYNWARYSHVGSCLHSSLNGRLHRIRKTASCLRGVRHTDKVHCATSCKLFFWSVNEGYAKKESPVFSYRFFTTTSRICAVYPRSSPTKSYS